MQKLLGIPVFLGKYSTYRHFCTFRMNVFAFLNTTKKWVHLSRCGQVQVVDRGSIETVVQFIFFCIILIAVLFLR